MSDTNLEIRSLDSQESLSDNPPVFEDVNSSDSSAQISQEDAESQPTFTFVPTSLELKDVSLNIEEVFLGRCPVTGITDVNMSRKVVSARVDEESRNVVIKQLHRKQMASCNGLVMNEGETRRLVHKGVLELPGGYKFILKIHPPISRKRLREERKLLKTMTATCLTKSLRPVNKKQKRDEVQKKDSKEKVKGDKEKAPSQLQILFGDKANSKEKKALNDDIDEIPASPEATKVVTKPFERKKVTLSACGTFVKSSSKHCKWTDFDYGNVLVLEYKSPKSSDRIASFDLDGTLITTKSGKVFPKDQDDWMIMSSYNPIRKLRELHSDGYKIVVFTNQKGVEKGKLTKEDLKKKLENVAHAIQVPCLFLAMVKSSLHRKPLPHSWFGMEKEFNGGVKIDMKRSFYVGDAAGRPMGGPKNKKDFSMSDRLFARNVGVRFYTPEEYFKGCLKEKFNEPEFDPRTVKIGSYTDLLPQTTRQEVVVLVGYPGSGKSYLAKKVFPNYERINKDTLKSQKKCMDVMAKALNAGKPVVVDNTNRDAATRAPYIKLAKEQQVPCRCIWMKTSKTHSRHNEKFRELTDGQHKAIPLVVFHTYAKNFQEPQRKEGFDDVTAIDFVRCVARAGDEKYEKLYHMFLLDS